MKTLNSFHGIMSSSCRSNSIVSISVNSSLIEGVDGVREALFNHFADHFRDVNLDRLGVENLTFKTLNLAQIGELIKPFCVKEVKQAVWDCDSYKSLGPDDINLGFIKDFQSGLKDYFMRFMTKFHRNGNLSKGVNNTFISLIPKVEIPQRLSDF